MAYELTYGHNEIRTEKYYPEKWLQQVCILALSLLACVCIGCIVGTVLSARLLGTPELHEAMDNMAYSIQNGEGIKESLEVFCSLLAK